MTQVDTGHARSIRVALPLGTSGFGLGTGILTSDGELPVEFLEAGDRVVTFDKGALPLTRVIVRSVPASEIVRVRPAVLDPEGDGRDILISARQKLVLRGWRAKAMFGKTTALVEAGKLVDGAHMARLSGSAPMRLFQLVFDDARHALQLAGGTVLAATAAVPAATGAARA